MPSKRNTPRFSLVRVRLNSGGYDSMGHYYGLGQKLWRFQQDAFERNGEKFDYLCGNCRAATRDAAMAYVRATFAARDPDFYHGRGQRH